MWPTERPETPQAEGVMTTSQDLIPTADALAIAKLLGDVAGMDADVPQQKGLLMRGLTQLTDADGWLWSLASSDHGKNQSISLDVIHEGLTDDQFAGWLEASQTADPPLPEDEPITRCLPWEDGRKHLLSILSEIMSPAPE